MGIGNASQKGLITPQRQTNGQQLLYRLRQ
jgi:hypothetical protein